MIRYPFPSDVEDIVELDNMFHHKNKLSESEYTQLIGRKNTVSWVCVENNKLVGFVCIDTGSTKELVIERLVFMTAEIGKKLLEQVASRKGFEEITAYVHEDDVVSLKFFSDNNFVSSLVRKKFGKEDGICFNRGIQT